MIKIKGYVHESKILGPLDILVFVWEYFIILLVLNKYLGLW